jgi:hypothetical protein
LYCVYHHDVSNAKIGIKLGLITIESVKYERIFNN